jgi:hypothetical protein
MSQRRIRYTDIQRAVTNTLRTIQDIGAVTTYTIMAGILTELGGQIASHDLTGQAATALVSGVIASVNAGIEISVATGSLTGALLSATGSVGYAIASGTTSVLGSAVGSIATGVASAATGLVNACARNPGVTGTAIGALGAYVAQNREVIANQANALQVAITSSNVDTIVNILVVLLSNVPGVIVENDDMAQRLQLPAPPDGVINRVQDDAITIASRLTEYSGSGDDANISSQSTINSEGLVEDVDMPNEEIDGAHENDDAVLLGVRKRGDDNESQSTTSSDRRFQKVPRSAIAEEEDRLSTGSGSSIASTILNYRANVHDLSNLYAILNVVAGITEGIRSDYVREDGTVDHASDLVAFQEQLETASSTCSSTNEHASESDEELGGGKKKRKTVRRKKAKKAAKKTAKKRVKKSAKKPAKKAARKHTKKA